MADSTTKNVDIEIYEFIKEILVRHFCVGKAVTPGSKLYDDLGLEPHKWYELARVVGDKYGCKLEDQDLTMFDRDAPTPGALARAVAAKLGYEQPIDESVLATVSEIISKVAEIDASGITSDQSFSDDLVLDSLSMINIATDCEDEFGVVIPDEVLTRLRDVQGLVNYISAQSVIHPAA